MQHYERVIALLLFTMCIGWRANAEDPWNFELLALALRVSGARGRVSRGAQRFGPRKSGGRQRKTAKEPPKSATHV